MKFDQLLSLDSSVWSLDDLSLIAGVSKSRLSVDLARWVKKEQIISLKAGVYALNPKYNKDTPSVVVSAKISSPSYVTDLSAMMHYAMIPEMIYTTIGVHLKRDAFYETTFGRFKFHRISPRLFFGFEEFVTMEGRGSLARPEKAVIDYLYLRRVKWEAEYIEAELRPTIDNCEFDIEQFVEWSELFPGWVQKGARAFLEVVA